MDEINLLANAICLDCGSTKENPITAFCVNGHDNWLESFDEIERFEIAEKRFGVPMGKILDSITKGIDLPPTEPFDENGLTESDYYTGVSFPNG